MNWTRFLKFLMIVIAVPIVAWVLIAKVSKMVSESQTEAKKHVLEEVVYVSPAWRNRGDFDERVMSVRHWVRGHAKPGPESDDPNQPPYESSEWTDLLLALFQIGPKDRVMWLVPAGLTDSGDPYRVMLLKGKLTINEVNPKLKRTDAPELYDLLKRGGSQSFDVGTGVTTMTRIWETDADPRPIWQPDELAGSPQDAEQKGFRLFLSGVTLADGRRVKPGSPVTCRGNYAVLGAGPAGQARVMLVAAVQASARGLSLVTKKAGTLKAKGRFDVTIDIPKASKLRTGSVIWGAYLAGPGTDTPISNVVLCKMRVKAD